VLGCTNRVTSMLMTYCCSRGVVPCVIAARELVTTTRAAL
jgi:hypothetical protein